MANFTLTGTTDYPTTLDTRSAVTSTYVAAHPDGLDVALIAIQTELGTVPKGSSASVKARLNTVDTSITNLTAASATIPTAKGSGQLVQMVSSSFVGLTGSGVAALTLNNNPFTSTQGTSFGDALLLNIRTRNANNAVYAALSFNAVANFIGTATVFAGLFLAGSTSAIHVDALQVQSEGAALSNGAGTFLWKVTTVSAATISYNIRFGGDQAFNLNQSATNLFGIPSLAVTSLNVYEVAN